MAWTPLLSSQALSSPVLSCLPKRRCCYRKMANAGDQVNANVTSLVVAGPWAKRECVTTITFFPVFVLCLLSACFACLCICVCVCVCAMSVCPAPTYTDQTVLHVTNHKTDRVVLMYQPNRRQHPPERPQSETDTGHDDDDRSCCCRCCP